MNKKRIEAFEDLRQALAKCKEAGFTLCTRYFNDDIGAHPLDSAEIEMSNEGPVVVFYADDLGWVEPEQILGSDDQPEWKIEI